VGEDLGLERNSTCANPVHRIANRRHPQGAQGRRQGRNDLSQARHLGRNAVQAVRERLEAKERPICRWIGVNRKLLHYQSRRNDEPLRLRLVALASEHRRYGLPRMIMLLRRDGVPDNHKRIGRIYRAAGLQVRQFKN
jgi:hypothetical protein